MSDWNSLFSLIGRSKSLKQVERSIILLRNVLPGGTTVDACCSYPITDSSCRFVQCFTACQYLIVSWSSANLSAGRRNSARRVSITMPTKVMLVDGPSTLSGATRTEEVRLTRVWGVWRIGSRLQVVLTSAQVHSPLHGICHCQE